MLHEHHEGAPYLSFGTPAIEIYIWWIQVKIANVLLYSVYFCTVRTLLCEKKIWWCNTFDKTSSFGGEGCQASWESVRNPSGTATSPPSPLPTTIIQLVCPLVNQRRNEGCHPSLWATSETSLRKPPSVCGGGFWLFPCLALNKLNSWHLSVIVTIFFGRWRQK